MFPYAYSLCREFITLLPYLVLWKPKVWQNLPAGQPSDIHSLSQWPSLSNIHYVLSVQQLTGLYPSILLCGSVHYWPAGVCG